MNTYGMVSVLSLSYRCLFLSLKWRVREVRVREAKRGQWNGMLCCFVLESLFYTSFCVLCFNISFKLKIRITFNGYDFTFFEIINLTVFSAHTCVIGMKHTTERHGSSEWRRQVSSASVFLLGFILWALSSIVENLFWHHTHFLVRFINLLKYLCLLLSGWYL
jgi:hypothetical protein